MASDDKEWKDNLGRTYLRAWYRNRFFMAMTDPAGVDGPRDESELEMWLEKIYDKRLPGMTITFGK